MDADFGQKPPTQKKTLHYRRELLPVVNPIFLSLCKSSLKALFFFLLSAVEVRP